MNVQTIYIRLLDEGVDCYFPATAEHLGGDRYRILDDAPDDPVWEFTKGDIVNCRIMMLAAQRDYTERLVAYKILNDPTTEHRNGR